jgi:hypothetical protein
MSKAKRLAIGAALTWALASVATPAEAGDRTKAYSFHCGLKAADLASTELAFAKNPVAYETNRLPGMQTTAGRAAWGVGTCAVAAEVDHRLRKHRKGRWVFRILAGGLMAYAVQNNLRVAGR